MVTVGTDRRDQGEDDDAGSDHGRRGESESAPRWQLPRVRAPAPVPALNAATVSPEPSVAARPAYPTAKWMSTVFALSPKSPSSTTSITVIT
ncbi:hypothetical protein CTI14_42690, partial [Methylobacterium radiotolerans]